MRLPQDPLLRPVRLVHVGKRTFVRVECDHSNPMGLIKHLRALEIADGRLIPFPLLRSSFALALAATSWEARASAAASA